MISTQDITLYDALQIIIVSIKGILVAFLLSAFAVPSIAGEYGWYMGSAEAQRIFEANRQECFERASKAMEITDDTYNYGYMFGICLGVDYEQLDSREGASYGVIVYDSQSEVSRYGIAWNYPSLTEAHQKAYRECARRGSRNCILQQAVRNGCIAMASGHDTLGFGSAGTEAEARSLALQRCAHSDSYLCKVEVVECSTARHR